MPVKFMLSMIRVSNAKTMIWFNKKKKTENENTIDENLMGSAKWEFVFLLKKMKSFAICSSLNVLILLILEKGKLHMMMIPWFVYQIEVNFRAHAHIQRNQKTNHIPAADRFRIYKACSTKISWLTHIKSLAIKLKIPHSRHFFRRHFLCQNSKIDEYFSECVRTHALNRQREKQHVTFVNRRKKSAGIWIKLPTLKFRYIYYRYVLLLLLLLLLSWFGLVWFGL